METGRAFELLERIGNLLRADERRLGSEFGLQPVQIRALLYLLRCNRYSDTPLAVAEYMGITKGTMSQTIIALERKGFIEKHPDKDDRRKVHLHLTDKGREAATKSAPIEAVERAFSKLSADNQRAFEDLLTSFLTTIQRENGLATFGVCRTCKHFRKDGLGSTHQCGLTLEPLTDEDANRICREHTEVEGVV